MEKRIIKHRAAKDAIIRLIARDGYAVGDAIPSVARLAKILKTGKMPVQQAVKMLEMDGILQNILGSGCYVKTLPGTAGAAGSASQDILAASPFPGISGAAGRKRITVAILTEMHIFGDLWKRLFIGYMSKQRGVSVELVSVGSDQEAVSMLTGRKADIVQIRDSSLKNCAERKLLFDPARAGGIEGSVSDGLYSSLRAASSWGGREWGVPLIAAINCMFYREKYAEPIRKLNSGEGFWRWLDMARKAMKQGGKSGLPAPLFMNNFNFLTLLSLAAVKPALSADYSAIIGRLGDAGIAEFASRFEPYLRDRSVCGFPDEACHSSPIETFILKDIPIVIGSSSWLPFIGRMMKDGWEFSTVFREEGGACDLAANVNVVSAGTPYPEECVEILNWLGSEEVQRYWSMKGRLVANRAANSALRLRPSGAELKRRIDSSIEGGRTRIYTSPHTEEYILNVMNPEFLKWQEGRMDARTFVDSLRRKARHFFSARTVAPAR